MPLAPAHAGKLDSIGTEYEELTVVNEIPHDKPKRYRALLLTGPPGSGKGTQGRILGQIPGFNLVSMGEVLHQIVKALTAS
jgi:hypothetical protein